MGATPTPRVALRLAVGALRLAVGALRLAVGALRLAARLASPPLTPRLPSRSSPSLDSVRVRVELDEARAAIDRFDEDAARDDGWQQTLESDDEAGERSRRSTQPRMSRVELTRPRGLDREVSSSVEKDISAVPIKLGATGNGAPLVLCRTGWADIGRM